MAALFWWYQNRGKFCIHRPFLDRDRDSATSPLGETPFVMGKTWESKNISYLDWQGCWNILHIQSHGIHVRMVYLLTCTIKNQPTVGKCTIHGSYGNIYTLEIWRNKLFSKKNLMQLVKGVVFGGCFFDWGWGIHSFEGILATPPQSYPAQE